jgi:nucleotidyltransferase/DNA polymerase involved in DNA repair
MPDRPIACIHIPRFAVEAERQRRNDAASRLILIGDATVFDCSLGAEASRVRRGMRMSEAIGLCTQALVLPPDMPYYERTFDALLDILGGFSPVVEAAPVLGTAFVSLSGLRAGPEALAPEIISALHRRTGFMATAGVADGKFAARVAALTAAPESPKIVPSGDERAFLAPLPIDLLPASEAMLWRLHLLGIETMGEITRMPLGAFQAQFGLEGKRCWDLSYGHDDEPLIPRVDEESIVRRLQMPAPALTLDAILTGVERLLRAAYADDGRGGRWVRKAVLRGTLDGGGGWELPIAFREALASPQDAWIAVKAAVLRRPPERAVEELEIELIGLRGESGKQSTMFEGKGKLWRQVEESIKQLETQREAASVGKVIRLEPWSRIPERRAALVERPGDV